MECTRGGTGREGVPGVVPGQGSAPGYTTPAPWQSVPAPRTHWDAQRDGGTLWAQTGSLDLGSPPWWRKRARSCHEEGRILSGRPSGVRDGIGQQSDSRRVTSPLITLGPDSDGESLIPAPPGSSRARGRRMTQNHTFVTLLAARLQTARNPTLRDILDPREAGVPPREGEERARSGPEHQLREQSFDQSGKGA